MSIKLLELFTSPAFLTTATATLKYFCRSWSNKDSEPEFVVAMLWQQVQKEAEYFWRYDLLNKKTEHLDNPTLIA